MFRIGEFSKMSLVSVRMLRHYDELGLLKPARVDDFTGYRYYPAEQLARLNRLRALRDMGLSLEQIRLLLDSNISPEQIKGMLRLKEAELERTINEGQNQLAKVKLWLRQLERQEAGYTQEAILKRIEPLLVASIREITADFSDAEPLMLELEAYLAQFGVPVSNEALMVYHDIETKEGNLDQEVCIALNERLPESDRVKVRELPAIETAATIVHAGLWEDTGDTYAILAHWIETNGYQMTGASRSLILDGELNGDPLAGVCEIILPVAKLLQEQN